MSKPAKELPSKEYLESVFYYKDGKLFWKEDNNKGGRGVKAGDGVKGWHDTAGYRFIMVKGQTYKISRLVYQLMYGNLTPDLVVDHINRNKCDDSIENLRAVSPTHNMRNCSKSSNNNTGVTGVGFGVYRYKLLDGTEKEYNYYSAHWREPSIKKTRSKKFNINKYGEKEAFRLACEYRALKIQELVEQGEWYDPNHGV